MEIPSRHTIFLQGVFFNQIQSVEDRMLSEERELSLSCEEPAYTMPAIAIPTKFRSIKAWKQATKDIHLRCWYCNISFSGVGCFIPKRVTAGVHGKEYDTHGWFCGFGCAYTHLVHTAEYHINRSYFDKVNMLKMLFESFYKRRVTELHEVPSRFLLSAYGGHLDLIDYKQQLLEVNRRIMTDSRAI